MGNCFTTKRDVEEEEIREGNNQAVSVLETVEEKIVDEPR